jgi:hypothetical protein
LKIPDRFGQNTLRQQTGPQEIIFSSWLLKLDKNNKILITVKKINIKN